MDRIPDGIDFEKYADFVGNQESQYITTFAAVSERIVERLRGGTYGDLLPWHKSHSHVQLRPKEVSIWAGINGHGKSQMTGMVCAWLMRTSRVLIASLEMPIEATAARMIRQCAGVENPADAYIHRWANWTKGRGWVYDQLDSVETSRIFGVIAYAAKELGVNHVFIDSLAKCGVNPDDYNGQKRLIDRMAWMAKTLGIHIHLVHHVRKGEGEAKKPDKFDVKGAGEIIDLCDNLFLVHRNKSKEAKARIGEEVDEPDASLICAKQRHGEWEGEFALWYHKESMQYTPDNRNIPIPWPNLQRDMGEVA